MKNILIPVILLLGWSTVSLGDNIYTKFGDNKLGGVADEHEVTIEVRRALEEIDKENQREVALGSIILIYNYLGENLEGNDYNNVIFGYFREAKDEVDQPPYDRLRHWRLEWNGQNQNDSEEDNLSFIYGNERIEDIINLLLDKGYTSVQVEAVIRSLRLVQAIAAKINDEPMVAHALDREMRRSDMWNQYFYEAIPQWPWEVGLNSYFYKNSANFFRAEPPEWQLIFVRPDIAMEYMPDSPDGEKFKGAFMVEVIGANFWEWETDGSMSGPLFGYPIGLGIVASYVDRADFEAWGYGAILHVNHIYNVGVVFRDSDPAYYFSLNFGKLFQKTQGQIEKFK